MENSMLITRPENDCTTRYLSVWSKEVIDEAKKKGINVIDLWRGKANRKRVISTLEKRAPRLVFLNGHGSDKFVRGYDEEIILKHSDRKAVKLKIIFARSCKSAKILGQKAITQGATAYLGYKEDFWFTYNIAKISRPLEDKTAALFLEPSNYLVISLLKDHSTGYANNKSKALFRKNIEKLLIRGPSAEDYDTIRYLYWDMINQVCLGSEEATF